jgi:hypothetical protein
MIEALPFIVCAFMWDDRQLLSQPQAKTVRKLKARYIVSTLLKFETHAEFVRRARRGGTSFVLDGTEYSINTMAADRTAAEAVVNRLLLLECGGEIDDKLRSFAHRLDLMLHAEAG